MKAAISGALGASLANPLAAIGKTTKRCKPGFKKCGPAKCCPPGTTCHTVRHKHKPTIYSCVKPEVKPPTCNDGIKNGSETDVDCGGPACPKCALGKHCLGGTDCTSGHCDGGICALCAADTDCPAAAAGSCQRSVCTAGVCGHTADDTNVPAGTACATGTCAAGVPGTTPVAADTSCGAGPRMVCDGQGNCVGCTTAADCPAAASGSCQKATCTAEVCGLAPDNTNVPSSTACSTGTCNAGVPTMVTVAAGTVCATSPKKVCDGAGNCVGCATAADCPAAASGSCQKAVCTANVCAFATDETNPPASTACATGTCVQGVPGTTPLAAETPCGNNSNMFCDGSGNCVGCVTSSDCTQPSNPCQQVLCTSNTCQAASFNAAGTCANGTCVSSGGGSCQCDAGSYQSGSSCLPKNGLGSTCGAGTECITGNCVSGYCCNTACTSSCQACSNALTGGQNGTCTNLPNGTACPGSDVCHNGNCVTTCQDGVKDGTETDVDCGGAYCVGLGFTCATGLKCIVGSDCTTGWCSIGQICQATHCTDGIKDGDETDIDCGGRTCAPCTTGQRCLVNADCASNVCTPVTLICA